ncbi:MAG: peptidylprolyl isomerase [Pleurocapsa sp. MO_192.B19]|nr:peptidylprolyl isomerase [Pleurocapsa sp. MO_192.B19]
MSEVLTFHPEDIFDQMRILCQLPTITEKIITREVVTRAAFEAGIEVESEELQQAADNWRLMNKLDSVEATQLWLQKHQLSLDEFGGLISATVLSSKLAQHLFGDKVKPYFLDYQLDYMQVAMYEIILDDEDLAMELSYAIDEGEIGFFEAAYQYIRDPELSRIGGYKGIVYRKDLKPEIAAAVFSATPPEILKPIITSSGVHLIKVEELIKLQLDDVMRQKILAELFSSWLAQQVRQYKVKINYLANQEKPFTSIAKQLATA